MRLPCLALLASFVLALSTSGASALAEEVPAHAPPAPVPLALPPNVRLVPPLPPPSRFGKPAMFWSGFAVGLAGAALLTGGVASYVTGAARESTCGLVNSDHCFGADLSQVMGIIMSAIGVAHIGVGVPLMIIGGRPAASPGLPGSAPPAPVAGARTFGLSLSF